MARLAQPRKLKSVKPSRPRLEANRFRAGSASKAPQGTPSAALSAPVVATLKEALRFRSVPARDRPELAAPQGPWQYDSKSPARSAGVSCAAANRACLGFQAERPQGASARRCPRRPSRQARDSRCQAARERGVSAIGTLGGCSCPYPIRRHGPSPARRGRHRRPVARSQSTGGSKGCVGGGSQLELVARLLRRRPWWRGSISKRRGHGSSIGGISSSAWA